MNGTWKKANELNEGILEGAAQIAVPALVSTLCICIVFLPMFFLSGVSRYLFVPLAEAVVFAMLASYALVANAGAYAGDVPAEEAQPPRSAFAERAGAAFSEASKRGFERVRSAYADTLGRG